MGYSSREALSAECLEPAFPQKHLSAKPSHLDRLPEQAFSICPGIEEIAI